MQRNTWYAGPTLDILYLKVRQMSPTNRGFTNGRIAYFRTEVASKVCNGVAVTPTGTLVNGVLVCQANQLTSNLIKIPAPLKENDDHNPQRMQPGSLFDLAAGDDNLFHGDRFRWSLRFTVINIDNKKVLYNFLSTFSGTHFVTPRAYTGELGFHF